MIKKECQKFGNSDFLEGMPSISALIKGMENNGNDRRIYRILFDRSKTKSKAKELGFLKVKSKEHNFDIELVTSDIIDEHTIGNTHGGIVAECSPRTLPCLDKDKVKENGVYFILEGVEDPYNFGYSVRSLYAAGVDGIVLGERNWMGAAGVVARSSAGASELIDLYVSDPISAIEIFRSKGYKIVCAGIRDSESIFDTDLSTPILVILGGEKRGISRNVLDLADSVIRIDYGGGFGGSLSTSAAAAVFAFEILRFNR